MNANPFDAYRLPTGMADGITIDLPNTPASFTVLPPSAYNDDYQAALLRAMNADMEDEALVDDDGNVSMPRRFDPSQMQRYQREAFFDACIREARGLPDGMSVDQFFDTYPLAGRFVLTKAAELARKMDTEIEAAMGNSKPLPNGKADGPVGSTITGRSKKAASSQKEVGALN